MWSIRGTPFVKRLLFFHLSVHLSLQIPFFFCLFSFVFDLFKFFVLWTHRGLCFCFFLGPRVAVPSPSLLGRGFLLGYCPILTIRGNEKQEGRATLGVGVALSSWSLGCHCFSFSWGRVDLPAWRPRGEPHKSWGFLLGVGVVQKNSLGVANASPFLGVGLIFLLGVGVLGFGNRQAPPKRREGERSPTQRSGKKATPPKGEGKTATPPKEGGNQAAPPN